LWYNEGMSKTDRIMHHWDLWSNGRTWTLQRGVHFSCEPRRFLVEARHQARARGLLVCDERCRGAYITFRIIPRVKQNDSQ
jgi:hypothetical protein